MAMWLALVLALQEDAAALVERLRSESPVERSEALTRLKTLGEQAVPALRAAEADADLEVAGHVAFLLRRVEVSKRVTPGLRAAAPGVEDQLAAGDPNAWTRVLFDLVTRRSGRRPGRSDLEPLAAPALRGARNEAERLWVCQTCEQMRFAAAAPELALLLKDPKPAVSEAALRALAAAGAPEALPECIRRLREGTPEARNQAASLLGRMRGRPVSGEVAALLGDPRADVRRAAVRVLRSVAGSDRAFVHEALLGALGDEDPRVRAEVAGALGSTGAKQAVSAIAKLLKEDPALVRVAAIDALGRLDAKAELAAVRGALGDVDAEVRGAAIRAIVTLGAREAANGVAGLLGDREAEVRKEALKALAELGARGQGDAVAACLADAVPEVRLAAAWAAGRLGAAAARPRLEAMLGEKSMPARFTAVAALRRMRAAESEPALLKRLADESPIVRGAAAEALGAIRAKEAAGPLKALLKDADPYARAGAARAAGLLGLADAAEGLVALLGDAVDLEVAVFQALRDEDGLLETPEMESLYGADLGTVRGAAARALVVLGRREGIGPLLEEADTQFVCDLTPLNAFRKPEVVAKLRAVRLEPGLPEAPLERLKEIARRAELGFEGEEPLGWPAALPPLREGTLWEALLETASESEYEVVLDDGKLRAVRNRRAQSEWEEWWEAQKAK
jgi:HEAT repeat protein